MIKDKKTLIKYRLERAEETLEEAKLLIEAQRYNGASNRIYYAMFYAVNALLLTKDLVSSKHSGVKALFNREFVKLGTIESKWGKLYEEAFLKRQQGDYLDYIRFTNEEVITRLEEAGEFVTVISNIIQREMSEKKWEDV